MVEQTYPFADVYTSIDCTRKRAVSESVIPQLYKLKLSEGSTLALARDIFIFSYCTRGMAFVDIAYLKKDNIQNGMICYARRKTGQLLSIRIEPCIQRIIDKYSSSSTYVFPILTSSESKEAYEEYQTAINNHNRQVETIIQDVARRLQINFIHLTTQLGDSCEKPQCSYFRHQCRHGTHHRTDHTHLFNNIGKLNNRRC